MAISNQSLGFCIAELLAGRTPAQVAETVKAKFEGDELRIALEYLRMQHRIQKAKNS